MRFNGYNHPDNFDITNRPSNASLTGGVLTRFILSAGLGAIVLNVPLLVFGTGSAVNETMLILGTLGAVAGTAAYLPFHLRNGRKQRREFISAGGDPTGISVLQFGTMGGKILPDGRWQWSTPVGSGD